MQKIFQFILCLNIYFALMAIRQIYQTALSMKFEYDNGEFTTR